MIDLEAEAYVEELKAIVRAIRSLPGYRRGLTVTYDGPALSEQAIKEVEWLTKCKLEQLGSR